MADTIFTGDNPNTTPGTSAPTGSTPATTTTDNSLVAALVGEGKKYKSIDDLAKAYINADGFIETLKQENTVLREKANAAKTIDDVLASLQSRKETQPDPAVKPDGVSVTDITKIVEQTMQSTETRKVQEANLRKADAKMKEMFGEKAAEVYKAAAATPEVHDAYMKLAAVDPDKFVALFVSDKTPQGQMTQGTISSAAIATTPSARENTVGTKEYFDKVRREKPSQYYSQEFQLGMDKAVRSNPTLYYGR